MAQVKIKQNIVELDIDSITPYEGSHKTDDTIDLLVRSIQEYGVNQPITIDKNNVVVTGNGVYKAAKIAGIKKIPCIMLDDLTDEEVMQYRIADDKTSEFASWNEKKLRKELSYLQDPGSMQPYFDTNILGMLGLNDKPRFTPQQEVSPEKQQINLAHGEQRFRDEMKKIDQEMMVKPSEYIQYTCSKCGRMVKVRRN